MVGDAEADRGQVHAGVRGREILAGGARELTGEGDHAAGEGGQLGRERGVLWWRDVIKKRLSENVRNNFASSPRWNTGKLASVMQIVLRNPRVFCP